MDSEKADIIVEEVVAALAAVRKEREVSLYRLAELTSLSREAIRLMEAGDRSPTLRSLVLLADALGADLGGLLSASFSPSQSPDEGSGK